MFGDMIQLFVGNGKFVDKVQPELIKFLEQKKTAELITVLIVGDWSILKKIFLGCQKRTIYAA